MNPFDIIPGHNDIEYLFIRPSELQVPFPLFREFENGMHQVYFSVLSLFQEITPGILDKLQTYSEPFGQEFHKINGVSSRFAIDAKIKRRIIGFVGHTNYRMFGCVFRSKAATYSAPFRPVIPIESGHPFRSKTAT